MAGTTEDVVIVGGGVAGLSAGIFTARHGLGTLVVEGSGSLLRRNAHLENYPGFPAGVNARLLLEMMRDQAQRAGCTFEAGTVTRVGTAPSGFEVEVDAGDDGETDVGTGATHTTRYVIAASKNEAAYLEDLEGIELIERGKTFVDVDDRGRTGVPGLYVAGRLAGRPHQTVVAAGHGATVGVTILEDDDRPFYHDWVAPERYFTGRGRDVPPGVEEIDDAERLERERAAIEVMRAYFDEPHPDPVEQHPSVDG